MIEKEISEIRRTLTKERTDVTHVKGCYVNAEKRIIARFDRSFALADEGEEEKYLSLFKRVLSGGLNKNLIDIPFSTAQVEKGEEHALLERLRKSRLQDEQALSEFFEKLAASVTSKDNYAALLICSSYDVFSRGKDDAAGESTEVYTFLLCALCPVKPGKAGLSYDPESKTFVSGGASGIVSAPTGGFLYPAFDLRKTNLYNALLYTKDVEAFDETFLTAIFGKTPLPMPAAEQTRAFRTVLKDALQEDCSLEAAKELHGRIRERLEEHKESRDPEPLLFSKSDLKQLLLESGMKEEAVQSFSESFNDSFGAGADLPPKNLIDPKRFELRSADVVVKVAPGREDLVSARIIDGVKYLLIRADADLEVNGLSVKI